MHNLLPFLLDEKNSNIFLAVFVNLIMSLNSDNVFEVNLILSTDFHLFGFYFISLYLITLNSTLESHNE